MRKMSLDLTLNYSQFNFEMLKSNNQKIYEFEDFRLDAAHLLLYHSGREIPLAPKVVETLLTLVENRGKILSTDEMMEKVWTDSIVEEGNLSQNLFRLRRALGETKNGKPFIETLRRRGYRFVPEVKIVGVGEEVLSPDFDRLPNNEIARSGSNGLPDKKSSENGTKNIHLAAARILDFPAKPPEGEAQKKPLENETRNSLPEPEIQNFSPRVFETPRRRSSSRTVLLLGFAALFIAVVSLGFALRSGWQIKNSKETNLRRLTESGNLHGAAISPDGNSLVYGLREGKNYSLRLKNISTESEAVIIPPTENAPGGPVFSPDGSFIYYSTTQGIFQIPIFGGESRRVAVNAWSNFSLSPDGRQIAFPRGNPTEYKMFIVVAETDGSGERIIATRTTPDYYTAWGPAPVWSPDGEHLTVVTGWDGSEEMRLVEINLQSGLERELKMQDTWAIIDFIGWASREELIISAHKKGEINLQIWSVKFPEGSAERVTNDFNHYTSFNVSKDAGKIVAVQGVENLHLWLFDKETGVSRQITFGVNRSDGRFGLAFTPDNRIVFTARDKNNYDIFSVNADGDDLRQLTKNAGQRNTDAVVSPDNQFIVFASERAGETRLFRMNADGTDARRLTTLSDGKESGESSPYFSPDGRWIYYVFWQNGKGSIRKISIDGGESVAVSQTDKTVYEPVPSPDGKFLAHAVYNDEAVATSPWQVAVMSNENPSEKERFFNFSAFRLRVRWLLDSNSVVSIDDQAGRNNLWQTNLTSGERQPITNFKTDKISRFDVSPDRRFYALTRGNYFYDAVLIER